MLYILPGMGTDKNMYKGWHQIKHAKFINWPTYTGEKSLSEIAEKIIKENSIKPNDWVGGSSFGGIMSIEIDKIIDNEKIILIGSAITLKEINPFLLGSSKLLYATPLKLI